jgi:putative hydrolase of the HAD superfamily
MAGASVPEITTMFWDVGGVTLSNGWDAPARAAAIRKFDLDGADFEARHELTNAAWECGRVTLATYLERTVFYRSREFTPEEFADFMFAQSHDSPEGHRIADEIARSGRYAMATLNNEAVELNIYRIRKFGLRKSFSAFFSSCFLGVRKPDREIYRIALEVMQREPAECLFVDDRALNLESARQVGMSTIQFRDGAQLRRELAEMRIVWESSE